jgi:hypothetical protein
LPSVSAAIGFNFQTSTIWFLLIFIHTPFRFIIARQLHQGYKKYISKLFESQYVLSLTRAETLKLKRLRQFVTIAYLINQLEILGLLILSTFTSSTSYGIEKRIIKNIIINQINH